MRRYLVNLLRVTELEYYIGIQIDRLTSSIINTFSDNSFDTEILLVTKEDLKGVTKKADWKFDWKGEAKLNDRNVYNLTIQGNQNIIQGLLSISDYGDHIFMHLLPEKQPLRNI